MVLVVWFMIYCTSSVSSTILRTPPVTGKGKDLLGFAKSYTPECNILVRRSLLTSFAQSCRLPSGSQLVTLVTSLKPGPRLADQCLKTSIPISSQHII